MQETSRNLLKREAIAGTTTFLAMAYILAVNPAILGDCGMPKGGVFVATVLASFIGTALMGLLADAPLAQAPGMGINAFFAYTIVLSMGYSYQVALLAVVLEGILFLLLSVSKVREELFNCIPATLKTAISIGLGFFIVLIALKNSGLVVGNPVTFVSFHHFSPKTLHTTDVCALLALLGILITAWLVAKGITGGILIGIFITWILGIIAEVTGVYHVDPTVGCFSTIPIFNMKQLADSFSEFGNLFGCFALPSSWSNSVNHLTGFRLICGFDFIAIVLILCFNDIFNTMGTLIGVTHKTPLIDENGKIKHITGILSADAIATIAGGLLGVPTTTTYVEASAGIALGGRHKWTAYTTALLFLASIVLAPIFLAIPGFATAPALVIVAFYMIGNFSDIDFNDYLEAIPAFICIMGMTFTYNIMDGICLGIISWTLFNMMGGRMKRINVFMYILTALFLAKYLMEYFI